MELGTGSTLAVGSQIINEGQTLLYGLVIMATGTGSDLWIYDGLDATSGRLILKILEGTKVTGDIIFNKPLRLNRGLYVKFGSKMSSLLVQWDPLIAGKLPGERTD